MRSLHLGNVSDEDLVLQIRSGQMDALAVLFDRHCRLVFSVGHRILQDSGEAEDLMQEVFLEVFRDAGKFDPARGSVESWILQYANHRSLNRCQHLQHRGLSDERAAACER
jgi:RNA polymerase sigma-70 factor (ECF subfamily)